MERYGKIKTSTSIWQVCFFQCRPTAVSAPVASRQMASALRRMNHLFGTLCLWIVRSNLGPFWLQKYHVVTWWKHVNCWLVGASWDCDARLFRIQGDCASCALTVAGNLEAMGYQNQMHHQMPPSKTSTHSVQISFPQWTRFVWDTDRYCMILLDEKYSELGM